MNIRVRARTPNPFLFAPEPTYRWGVVVDIKLTVGGIFPEPGALQDEWSRAVMCIPRILAATDIPLKVDYRDDSIVIVGDDGIRNEFDELIIPTTLAGAASLANDDTESCFGSAAFFVATGGREYDVVVRAILCALEHYSLDFNVGVCDSNVDNWQSAVALARSALGNESIGAALRCREPDYWDRWHERKLRRWALREELKLVVKGGRWVRLQCDAEFPGLGHPWMDAASLRLAPYD